MEKAKVSLEGKHQERDLIIAREFADNHAWFDDTFISSLEQFFEKNGYLTDKQYTALQKNN